jgi:hypothetical protein
MSSLIEEEKIIEIKSEKEELEVIEEDKMAITN